MGSLLKWLFGLVLFLVVLVVGAVVYVTMVIDPNDYKPQIVEQAKEKLGRDIAIEQDLSLTFYPWLGIQTGGVRVGNAEGFKAKDMAEIDELGIRVKLWPLLSKRVEVDTLVLKGLRLNLEKNAQGKTNWDDLTQAAEKDAAEKPEENKASSEGGPPVQFSVQGVQIEQGRISWDDRQAGKQYVLDGVRLVTGALEPGASVPVEAGVLFTSNAPAMKLDASLEVTLSSDDDLVVFKADGLQLVLDAEGEGLPSGGAKLTLKTNMVADTKADTMSLDQLEITGPAMKATGNVAVSEMRTNPQAKGNLKIAETNLKTLASMFAAPIETTDPQALTKAGGELSFNYANGAVKLDPLKITLDESELDGYVHVLKTDGPVIRTKLTLNEIDLDRYMPPAATGAEGAQGKPAGEAKGGGAKSATVDPFAGLRKLDFEGDFKIGKLKVNNARMSNVTAKVVSKGGVLKVEPMAADLYEGKFKGATTFDARGKQPKLALNNSLTGIQVGQLLKDVAGEDRLIGKGELHADISMVGMSEAEIRRTLNGTSRFAFTDGAFKGVNIAETVRKASAALGIESKSMETGTPGQTDFSELSGSLKMTNGVIKNDDLQAKSPLLRIDGKGEVNLPKNTIDYLVVTELVKSLAGQGGKSRDELSGVPIPVRVTGPLDKPSYRPDLQAALNAKAKEKIEEKKEELKSKAEEKVREKLDGALKGLFK